MSFIVDKDSYSPHTLVSLLEDLSIHSELWLQFCGAGTVTGCCEPAELSASCLHTKMKSWSEGPGGSVPTVHMACQ